jgi:hypothetical protein
VLTAPEAVVDCLTACQDRSMPLTEGLRRAVPARRLTVQVLTSTDNISTWKYQEADSRTGLRCDSW